MNAESIFGAAVTMCAIWYLVCFIMRNTALEWYRQSIFQIRDQLFIDAAGCKDGLSLQDPAYRTLRDQLNARIRFANKVVPMVIASFWLIPSLRNRLVQPGPSDSEISHSPASKHLKEVLRVANLRTFEFFCYVSPVFWICSAVLFAGYRTLKAVRSVSTAKVAKMAKKNRQPPVAEFQYSSSTLIGVTAGPRGEATRACRFYDRLAQDHDQMLLAA